jgi:hypothetical protein
MKKTLALCIGIGVVSLALALFACTGAPAGMVTADSLKAAGIGSTTSQMTAQNHIVDLTVN